MAIKLSRNSTKSDPVAERLASFRARMLGRAWPNIIAGRQDVSGRAFEVPCPFERGLVAARLIAADAPAVAAAAEAARLVQPAWAASSKSARAGVLSAIAKALEARAADLALALVFERGQCRSEAMAEADAAARAFGQAATALKSLPEADSRPFGVMALIANAGEPLRLLAAMAAPALACGNGVLLRPAAQGGLAAAILMEALAEAGLPDGLANMLCGEEAGLHMAECPGIDAISYAGPAEAGLKLQRKAGLKAFGLHARGRNCAIITASADLDLAAAVLAEGVALAAGAGLGALSAAFVAKPVLSAFAPKLRKAMDGFRPGPVVDTATRMSLLADAGLAERHDRLARLLRQKGRVLAGGEPAQGLAVRPLAAEIPADFAPLRDEPPGLAVLKLVAVAGFEDALQQAGKLPRGRLCLLFSGKPAEIKAFGQQAFAAELHINPKSRPDALSGLFPLAGFRTRRQVFGAG